MKEFSDQKSVGLNKMRRNGENCSENPCRNFAGIEGSPGVTILGIYSKLCKIEKGVQIDK